MKTKILFLWELLRTSFWFIPLIIVLFAIGASFGLIYLDSIVKYQPTGLFLYFFSGGVESARSVLATIAGAMLGMASTVFSITLVALTLASSQFGSRLLRNFMHDRLNQTVLGTYVATFIFCLLVLRTVNSIQAINFVPNISILFAISLAIANILLLIIFIHHISVSIQADQVISDIGINLDNSIKTLFPEDLGESSDKENEADPDEVKAKLSHHDTIICLHSGYLQIVDNDILMELTQENDLLLTFKHQPGDFLVEKVLLAELYSKNGCEDGVKQRIQDAFVQGDKRTPLQDAEFAIHQMVEIAARALSPGVNDPYTAITCIDKLTSSICYLLRAKFPSGYRYDKEGNLRIIVKPLTFDGMVNAAFNQIRQFGKGSPAILIRMMESLIIIYELARTESHKQTINRHAGMVYRAAADFDPGDLDDLKERMDQLKKLST